MPRKVCLAPFFLLDTLKCGCGVTAAKFAYEDKDTAQRVQCQSGRLADERDCVRLSVTDALFYLAQLSLFFIRHSSFCDWLRIFVS